LSVLPIDSVHPAETKNQLGICYFPLPFLSSGLCRDYNERTGTPFNRIEVPTDIVFEVLLCRVRYKLSYRDVAEYFLFRGFQFTHETVRNWEERFLPFFTEQIREKRRGKVEKTWKVDETYVRFKVV
jgi:hypothetical protein